MQPDNENWNKTFSASTNWTVITASLERDEFWFQIKNVSGPTCFLFQEGTYVFPDTPLDPPYPVVFKGLGNHNNSQFQQPEEEGSSSPSAPPPLPPPSKAVILRNGNKAFPVIIIDGKEGCVFEGISFISDSMDGCVVVRDGPAKFIDCQFRMSSKAASLCAVVQVKYHCALLQCDFDCGPIGIQINEPESPFDLTAIDSTSSSAEYDMSVNSKSPNRPDSRSRLTTASGGRPSSSGGSSVSLRNHKSMNGGRRTSTNNNNATINVKIEDCGFTGRYLRDAIGAFGMCKLFCSHVSIEDISGTGIVFGGACGGFVKDSVVVLCGKNGVVVECLSNIWLRQCSIERCGGIGIQVCGMAKPSIMNCTIEGNAHQLEPTTSTTSSSVASPYSYPPPQIHIAGASAPRFTQNEVHGVVPVAANDVGYLHTSTTLVIISDAADGTFDSNTLNASKGDKGVVLDGNTTVAFKGNAITMDVESLLEAYEDAGKDDETILVNIVHDNSLSAYSTSNTSQSPAGHQLRLPVKNKKPQRFYAVTLGPWQQAKLQGGNVFRYHDISGLRNTLNRDGEQLIHMAPRNALYVTMDQMPSWSMLDWNPRSQIPAGYVEKMTKAAAASSSSAFQPRRPQSGGSLKTSQSSAATGGQTPTATRVNPSSSSRRPSQEESVSSARRSASQRRPGTAPSSATKPKKPPVLSSPRNISRKSSTKSMNSSNKKKKYPIDQSSRPSTPLTHQEGESAATQQQRHAAQSDDSTTPEPTRPSTANPYSYTSNSKANSGAAAVEYEKEIGQLKSTISQLKARLRSGSQQQQQPSAHRRIWNQHTPADGQPSHHADGTDGDSPRVFAEEVRIGRYVWDKSKLKDFNRLMVPLSEVRREADSSTDRQGYWKDIPARLHDQWLKSRQTAQRNADHQREEEENGKPRLTLQQQQEMAVRMHDESMRLHSENKLRVREAVIRMEKESRFSKVLHSSRHQSRPKDRFGEPAPLTEDELKEFNDRIYYEHKEKKEEMMKMLHNRYDCTPSPPCLSTGNHAKTKATAKELEVYCASLSKGHKDAAAASKAAEVLGHPIFVREEKTRDQMYPPLIPNQKVAARADLEAYCTSLYKNHAGGYPEPSSNSPPRRRPGSSNNNTQRRSPTASPIPPPSPTHHKQQQSSPTRVASSMAQVASPPPSTFSDTPSHRTNPVMQQQHTPTPPARN